MPFSVSVMLEVSCAKPESSSMRQAQAYSTPLFRKTRTLETKKLFLASRVLSGAHFAWLVSDVSVESPSLDTGEKSWQRNGTTWVFPFGQ